MLVSVGVLAYNEELSIERTLRSLFDQSVFLSSETDLSKHCWEIIVVPNGCTDRTAEIATAVLSNLVATSGRRDLSWLVHETSTAGKSIAWNQFVHLLSNRQAELIVLMDADIEFGEATTLANVISTLLSNPQATVAVDQPLKDALKKGTRTALERLSLMISADAALSGPKLAGSFYCAKAKVLREVWMPEGLSVEDGFLAAMLCSNCMREPVDYQRIIQASTASHYFETLTSIRAIFQHELRLVIGSALNCYLIWDFLLFATDPTGPGAGALIRNQMAKDPQWYAKLMINSISNHGWWVLPRGMLFRRFSGLFLAGRRPTIQKVLAATFLFLFDLPVFLRANSRLKKSNAIGYW